MNLQFRHFIEHTLYNPTKPSSTTPQQITVQRACLKLQKLIQKSLHQPSTTPQMTVPKIPVSLDNLIKTQQKTQQLQRNDIYCESLKEVTTFIFKLAYGHPGMWFYPKYEIENVIGFYEISKHLYRSKQVFDSEQLRRKFDQEVIGLLFTQKIMTYKDVYYRIEESSVFRNFIDEIFGLITQRIRCFFTLYGLHPTKQLVKCCESHIRSFIEVYQMTQSLKGNNSSSKFSLNLIQSTNLKNTQKHRLLINSSLTLLHQTTIETDQHLNSISIDQIIICFTFLVYKQSPEYTNISMDKLIQGYFTHVLRWGKGNGNRRGERIVELYNECYLKLWMANKLEGVDKAWVGVEAGQGQRFQAEMVENGETILDNFVSSFEN